ncbi:MAG: DEAD/DEAH box helicase, partial [Thermoplasmata archaeon]|nr:DEAD/DEAH box helicase [Thermoplasmata archaeon]
METKGSFEELDLDERMMKNIKDMGYRAPTVIQWEVIPLMREGKDVIGQAKTGTGKTAAFGIPIIEHLLAEVGEGEKGSRDISALILTPTRELAIQVAHEIGRYGKGTPARPVALYGGQKIDIQLRELRKGANIVVATPGRLIDHMKRGLDLSHIRFFILDEADRMLDMGFIDDIRWVISRLPENRQNALFSATMPLPIRELASEYMRDPVECLVSKDEITVRDISQVYYSVGRLNKLWALMRVLDVEKPTRAMIFCETKMMTQRVGDTLKKHGYAAEAIHGDLPQKKRERVMAAFKEGKIRYLVATDVAARGLDIEDVSHVINYDIPEDPTVYVHRIGRTG